jgi:hypothetical protein
MNYGNPMIGLRAVKLPRNASLVVWQSQMLERAGMFSDRPPSTAFGTTIPTGLLKLPSIRARRPRACSRDRQPVEFSLA